MSVDVEAVAPTVLIAEARVRRSERISPAFVRVTLESPSFGDLGREGFDTRLKLVLPGPSGELPPLWERPEDWYAHWMAMPGATRSPMRTYTVRDVLDQEGARVLVVDLVVHEDGPQGPACRWALDARPGAVVQVIAPHRGATEYGGTEFTPGERRDLLLVGDETALPALTRILGDVTLDFTGHVFVEVPSAEDVLSLPATRDIEVTWLVRDGAEHGRRLVDEVRRHLDLDPLDMRALPAEPGPRRDVEVWETPRHSSSGEDLEAAPRRQPRGADLTALYAWIAGETWLVKALRRTLVTELGVDRGQVAFMGYWREGVAMRS